MTAQMSDEVDTAAACHHCGAKIIRDGDWKLCSRCGISEAGCRCAPEADEADR